MALRRLSRKADSRTSDSVMRSPLKLVSVYQEPVHIKLFKKKLQQVSKKPLVNERRLLPKLWRKKTQWVAQWSKVLFSKQRKFCLSFRNQGQRVWRKNGEAQNPRCLQSKVCDDVRCHVICWCNPFCFITSKVNTAVYQISANFMLLSADKLYGDTNLVLQQGLASDHWAKTTLQHFLDPLFVIFERKIRTPHMFMFYIHIYIKHKTTPINTTWVIIPYQY